MGSILYAVATLALVAAMVVWENRDRDRVMSMRRKPDVRRYVIAMGRLRNPVAKHARRANRAFVLRDRSKYTRKRKHRRMA